MGVLIMKKNKILNLIKLGMLAIMLILLFFISERFVDYIVTVDTDTLTKAVYVILATTAVGIYTIEPKEKEKTEKVDKIKLTKKDKKEQEKNEQWF